MKLIVGLGNPGIKYLGTRHNIGFDVIDCISDKYNINMSKIKHKAFIGDGFVMGEKIILLKPQTYMNLSGESVKEAMQFYKIQKEDVIVIYDDTSLPLSAVRIREKGSAGGHNGMKSIIAHVGSDEFLRIKVGINEKPNGWDLADYVLSRFTKDEEPLVISGCEKSVEAVEGILKDGTQKTMNKINVSVKKKKEKKEEVSEEKEEKEKL